MPSTARVAVALLLLAVALFASPLYADALLGDEPDRSNRVLDARELGRNYEGEPIDETEDLLDTYDDEHVLDLGRYAALSARGSTDHLPCNRAVNGTVAVMREATAEGNATTTDAAVAADLRCMADRHEYYWPPDDQREEIRAFSVSGEGGAIRVETSRADESEVAAAIRERELVRYGELNASERETVDRIIGESHESEYGGYRPPADDPILDRTPLLVERDGTTYVIETYGHVDDFNFARLLFVLGLAALGVVCLLGALVAGGYELYRRARSES